jgi:hypothetical protein
VPEAPAEEPWPDRPYTDPGENHVAGRIAATCRGIQDTISYDERETRQLKATFLVFTPTFAHLFPEISGAILIIFLLRNKSALLRPFPEEPVPG